MAVTSTLHTLSVTAEVIARGPSRVVVSKPSATVYVGGAGVSTTNGFEVAAATVFEIDLPTKNDALYAIASSATPTVRVLTTRGGEIAP